MDNIGYEMVGNDKEVFERKKTAAACAENSDAYCISRDATDSHCQGSKKFPYPLYRLRLDYTKESFYGAYACGHCPAGSCVVVQTRYGEDVASVVGIVKTPQGITADEVVMIQRKITEADKAVLKENARRESFAAKLFEEKISAHNLNMKLINCHYLFNDSKALFFFTSETRIDFRMLVKDLVSILKIRIELRQVGVRDEARLVGGLGSCGRPFCCHSIGDTLRSVSIKMAKEQHLSLNSAKISGQCGRLLCCLAYEYDWYSEAKKRMPTIGSTIYYDNSVFRITDINFVAGTVMLSGKDGRTISLPCSKFKLQGSKWKVET